MKLARERSYHENSQKFSLHPFIFSKTKNKTNINFTESYKKTKQKNINFAEYYPHLERVVSLGTFRFFFVFFFQNSCKSISNRMYSLQFKSIWRNYSHDVCRCKREQKDVEIRWKMKKRDKKKKRTVKKETETKRRIKEIIGKIKAGKCMRKKKDKK